MQDINNMETGQESYVRILRTFWPIFCKLKTSLKNKV